MNHAAREPHEARCRFESVGKTYRALVRRRTSTAIQDFSLEVPTGEIFGIAGPNGAGKSTLISLLLGFIQPSAGRVTIGGLTPRAYVERYGVGYLSELVAIPPTWTVEGTLRRYAVLAAIPVPERPRRIEEVITLLGLDEQRRKLVRQLSKGNLQRLGLAQALLSDSDLVILDEPTHGFDPVWTQRFREIGRALKRPGRTVIIASHNLDELERVADRVGIIDRGRLQHVMDVGTHVTALVGAYRVTVTPDTEHLVAAVFATAERVGDGRVAEFRIPATDVPTLNAGLRSLLASGGQLVAVRPEESRLESVFRETIGVSQ